MKKPTSEKSGKLKPQKQKHSRDAQKGRISDNIDPKKIIRYGEIVYEVFWDSGAPGAGADSECVYKWQNWYAVSYSFGNLKGPYKSLSAAVRAGELNVVTEATVSITSREQKADEIARILRLTTDPPFTLSINNEIWLLSKDGRFIKEDPSGIPTRPSV